jgi:23S rRNA (cytosine1962-C5)-methyltransferase
VKAGHVQPLWAGHPWVFRQAVERVEGNLEPGDEVLVIDPHGKVLGRGLYSPASAISVRLFTGDAGTAIDGDLFRAKIEKAVKLRQGHGLPEVAPGRETSGYRVVHGEGDGLPGLIVDLFEDVAVVQLGTIGLARRREEIVAAIAEVLGPKAILDRTPSSLAKAEGFEIDVSAPRMLLGSPPAALSFRERGLRYELPLELTQKTGYYFDQRPLRDRIEVASRGSRVLDACCYVGPMALAAARGGASKVWAIDKSAPAIDAARHCAALNGLGDRVEFEVVEAQQAFRKAADEGGWDVVICDPPKLASSRRTRHKGAGGYRKLAAGACAATSPGGLLAFCSCSATMTMDALQRALALGARDARRRAAIVDRCFQGVDHPVVAAFPEGLYLKVLIARVDEA